MNQRFPLPDNYRGMCGKNVAKHPYGELGSVERGNCCCCVAADSAFGPISPGCGCDGEKVDDIVTVLKERMRSRGDTAQIKLTEETLLQLQKVDEKLVRRSHFNIKRNKDKVPMCCMYRNHLSSSSSIISYSSQNLIMEHLKIPQPEKMGDREPV